MYLAYAKPISATACEGEVVISGEGRVWGSFTPDAVLASLDGLRNAAETASGQRKRLIDALMKR